jgi:TonB family protein
MSPRALLLSPDDQAVSAITGVLEELSVLCERPRDGASAAQKLNSQSYDLVLVDCDNLPAAKLIFDVCRRAHAGTSIPIAIVDGRAGLPTAFRLGAELILTKPVAKDQARSTIRTAVSRLRKEEPVRAAQPLEPALVEVPESTIPETLAQAATVGALSAPAAAVSAPAKTVDLTPLPALPVVVDAPKALPAPEPVALAAASPMQVPESPTPTEKSSRVLNVGASTAPKASLQLSEDPVLAELEKAETEIQAPIFSSYDPSRKPKKGRGALVALLLLAMVGAGFYAAWMLKPEFRALVQPQLDKAMAMVGMLPPQQNIAPAPVPAAPVVKTPVPQTPAPTQSVSGSTAANPVLENASQPNPVPTSTSAVTGTLGTASPTTTPTAKAASSAADDSEAENSKSAATPPQTELPWEKETVILSSKGAEKRLMHQVPPAYTGAGRSQKIEGTVVLKTLVGENGAVEGVRLIEGSPVLASAATKAVKQWRYKPYIRDGSRVPFQTIVIVDFQRP